MSGPRARELRKEFCPTMENDSITDHISLDLDPNDNVETEYGHIKLEHLLEKVEEFLNGLTTYTNNIFEEMKKLAEEKAKAAQEKSRIARLQGQQIPLEEEKSPISILDDHAVRFSSRVRESIAESVTLKRPLVDTNGYTGYQTKTLRKLFVGWDIDCAANVELNVATSAIRYFNQIRNWLIEWDPKFDQLTEDAFEAWQKNQKDINKVQEHKKASELLQYVFICPYFPDIKKINLLIPAEVAKLETWGKVFCEEWKSNTHDALKQHLEDFRKKYNIPSTSRSYVEKPKDDKAREDKQASSGHATQASKSSIKAGAVNPDSTKLILTTGAESNSDKKRDTSKVGKPLEPKILAKNNGANYTKETKADFPEPKQGTMSFAEALEEQKSLSITDVELAIQNWKADKKKYFGFETIRRYFFTSKTSLETALTLAETNPVKRGTFDDKTRYKMAMEYILKNPKKAFAIELKKVLDLKEKAMLKNTPGLAVAVSTHI